MNYRLMFVWQKGTETLFFEFGELQCFDMIQWRFLTSRHSLHIQSILTFGLTIFRIHLR